MVNETVTSLSSGMAIFSSHAFGFGCRAARLISDVRVMWGTKVGGSEAGTAGMAVGIVVISSVRVS